MTTTNDFALTETNLVQTVTEGTVARLNNGILPSDCRAQFGTVNTVWVFRGEKQAGAIHVRLENGQVTYDHMGFDDPRNDDWMVALIYALVG